MYLDPLLFALYRGKEANRNVAGAVRKDLAPEFVKGYVQPWEEMQAEESYRLVGDGLEVRLKG